MWFLHKRQREKCEINRSLASTEELHLGGKHRKYYNKKHVNCTSIYPDIPHKVSRCTSSAQGPRLTNSVADTHTCIYMYTPSSEMPLWCSIMSEKSGIGTGKYMYVSSIKMHCTVNIIAMNPLFVAFYFQHTEYKTKQVFLFLVKSAKME